VYSTYGYNKLLHHLRASSERMTDSQFRKLIFAYCQLYQEDYWFEQLDNAFTYLEHADNDGDSVRTELPFVRSEVEEAMGEYFESLNEVATTIHRLLNDAPLTANDTIACVAHIWNAPHATKIQSHSVREKIEFCVNCSTRSCPTCIDERTIKVEEPSTVLYSVWRYYNRLSAVLLCSLSDR
jgi:hypothetical protein